VWLEELEGGICSGYRILEVNPSDDKQLQPTLENHLRLFGRPPRSVAADRGCTRRTTSKPLGEWESNE
jgi:IS5 family transposase